MAVLAKLKTSKKDQASGRETVENRLRRKMKERLAEQREFVEADLRNQPIMLTKKKWVLNQATGQSECIDASKRARRWYWKEADGNVCMKLLYGNSPLAYNGESSTIEVKELARLPEAIDTLMEAIDQGELDTAMKEALGNRRSILRPRK